MMHTVGAVVAWTLLAGLAVAEGIWIRMCWPDLRQWLKREEWRA